jgi:hypothetical protein
VAAVLAEIYLCGVCSCQEVLRRSGRGQAVSGSTHSLPPMPPAPPPTPSHHGGKVEQSPLPVLLQQELRRGCESLSLICAAHTHTHTHTQREPLDTAPVCFHEPGTARIWWADYAAVSFTDHNVGRVLDALEAQGLKETTAVLFHADHVGVWLYYTHHLLKRVDLIASDLIAPAPCFACSQGWKLGCVSGSTCHLDIYLCHSCLVVAKLRQTRTGSTGIGPSAATGSSTRACL